MKLSIAPGASPRAPVPLARRVARVAHLVWHVARGLFILRSRFPRMEAAERRAVILNWSGHLLQILGAQVRIEGSLADAAGRMLVMNHSSWLDVYAVLASVPVRFVAKAEIRSWPFIGRLTAGAGTLFIERGRSRHAHRTNGHIAGAMRDGEIIAVFPEGTTSEGDVLLPFHAALFQPAVDAAALVQPLALRYMDTTGAPTKSAAYAGDTSLAASLWRITGEPSLTIVIDVIAGIDAAGKDRRSLARECEEAIARALRVTAPNRRAPRTASHPLAEAP
jgi:1-acyl-sn-glycerol-3-phosphate acyltransferase